MRCLTSLLIAAVVSAVPAVPAGAALVLEPVLTAGLTSPIYATHARDGSGRLFVVERGGLVKVFPPGGTTPATFLDITDRVLAGGEQGLLGLAFHPAFATNRRFFVHYTRDPDGATVIAEFQASAVDPDFADPAGETVLLTVPQPFANHNGGMLEFGPDGFLYIALGDGGSANDPGDRAQDAAELLGKILRLDIDTPSGSLPYSAPAGNPYAGSTPGRDEIYALGLRNPWRFSFDRLTGDLYAGDVGQGSREEVDLIVAGGNYGWRVFEGTQCTSNQDGSVCLSPPFVHVPPIAEYTHANGRCSITGGYVYRGLQDTLPAGTYVFADFCTGEIFSLLGGVVTLLLDTTQNIASFGEDEDGELFVVGLGGTVHRLAGGVSSCSYAITPTERSFTAGSGKSSVTVTTEAGCSWTATDNASWISITSGAAGTGNGTVTYTVTTNTSTTTRTGAVTVAGQTHTVTQAGATPTCRYSLSVSPRRFGAEGGPGTVSVSVGAGCAWTATSTVPWITITAGASGTGTGAVQFVVAANSGGSRSGQITIGGRSVDVKQRGAGSSSGSRR
jgi:hypothetical protein